MNPKIRVISDILLTISFLASAISGLLLKYYFISGPAGREMTFLALLRHDWSTIHSVSSIIFIILVAVHFIAYWNVIKCAPKVLKQKNDK
jgi:hypothetical protein